MNTSIEIRIVKSIKLQNHTRKVEVIGGKMRRDVADAFEEKPCSWFERSLRAQMVTRPVSMINHVCAVDGVIYCATSYPFILQTAKGW